MTNKRLVLVGGGHAHLPSLKYADRFIAKGAQVTLIAPNRHHYYSGMGPGMISRIYHPRQVRLDVKAMIESRGGTFVQDKVTHVDPEKRTLYLESGNSLDYDLVSFNIGSIVPVEKIPGAQEHALAVKPIEHLEQLRKQILTKMTHQNIRIAIIGGGPAGIEIAGNVAQLVQGKKRRAEIVLLASRERILNEFGTRATHFATRSLTRRGVQIKYSFRAAYINDQEIHSTTGEQVVYDLVVAAIGTAPAPIFAQSNVPTANDGSLLVNECLQSPEYLNIFGGGDCITIENMPLPRIGLYAVRQGPILFENLMASLQDRALKAFNPQKRSVLILNMGDGTGIWLQDPWTWQGRLAFGLKQLLDLTFVRRYQHL